MIHDASNSVNNPQTSSGGISGGISNVSDVLAHLDRLSGLVDAIDDDTPSLPEVLPHLQQLRVLERVIDGLAVHTDNDELLADAMEHVASLTGSHAVWIVEATQDEALGVVHMLGEVVVGPSDLPTDVARLCKSVFSTRPHPERQRIVCSDGSHATAMPILANHRYFGSLIFATQGGGRFGDDTHDRLLRSILRYVAVFVENRHYIESLNEMIVEVVCAFSLAIESRDAYTGGHVQRVTAFAVCLAEALGMSEDDQAVLRLGGLLHDIGKVAIPDEILNKPAVLTREEFDIIRAHPVVGYEILKRIPHLEHANQVVRHHHERWDGLGYPDRLAGENIPVFARVLAIADSFDAMTSDRAYRKTMTHEQAMAEIQRCAGTHFDAVMAAVFCTFTQKEFSLAERRMHEWIQSQDHSSGIAIDQLVAMRKPAIS